MPQIFRPSTNTFFRASLFGAFLFVAFLSWVGFEVSRSSYITEAGVVREQPVPFSHKHHVGELGLDCRYCHTSVEDSPFAGLPPTKTCMTCHAQIWVDSPMLEPVRDSFRTGQSLVWTRVHDLADFVYFDHGIHVSKGIGCVSCHGRVDQMPLMWREHTLQMRWCLECHRRPERFVGPRDQVFNLAWEPSDPGVETGEPLVEQYGIEQRTTCSTCHR